ncbi:nucleotide exchange factor GrpE, partial [Patescibacteria group bacterium]|nr:nucleotide exchange factor GrpE [Patescibacteria group bacterium]
EDKKYDPSASSGFKEKQPNNQNDENIIKDENQELAMAKKKMEEYLNGWKRAKADYSNLKKESDKKMQDTVQFANAALILQLLPIFDNFKLAWQHIPEEHKKSDEWLKGIEQIKNQFRDLLKNLGIEEIKTVGEKFNPEIHESVAKEKIAGKASGIITDEVVPGYKLFDKTLEPAKVKVAE